MKDILEELYYCRVRPSDEVEPKAPEYREANKEYLKRNTKFMEKLTEELRREYMELLDQETESESYYLYETFAVGYRLGARLAVSIFMEGTER